MRRSFSSRNLKKPKTAQRLRRYRCAICRKKVEKSVSAPYYCPKCRGYNDPPEYQWGYSENEE